MTTPAPTVPVPPYSVETRKQMATQILATQDSGTGFKLSFVTVAALRLIAKDGGKHAISDQTLQADYKVGTIGGKPSNPVSLPSILSFLQLLTLRETWIRIGEGVLGFLLIAVGVAELAGREPYALKPLRNLGK